jgi:hypothetical protein
MLVSARLEEWRERAEIRARMTASRTTRRRRAPQSGRAAQRPARDSDEAWVRAHRPPHGAIRPTAIPVPPNVKINDRSGDLGFGSGQSEVSVAVHGHRLLAAWNDGEGNRTGGDLIGCGWSIDGGASWTDSGTPPRGTTVGKWLSDPVITVNEKSGEFYLCGMVITSAARNGIAVIKGTFADTGLVWEPPTLARIAGDTLPDKPWIAVDSLTGVLAVAYTSFERNGQLLTDQIEFQTSPDGGASWSGQQRLSGDEEQGLVQGPRPVFGPHGEIYVAWTRVDTSVATDGLDYIRVRRSDDGGRTFAAAVDAARLFSNFGSGAPGFNRGYGFTWPSIAVDRSRGHHRGRVYLAWNESVDFFGDPLGTLPGREEAEPNASPSTATPFELGESLHGSIASGDIDLFGFDAVQGQTGVFFVDSTSVGLNLAFRILCADGDTRLAYNEPIGVRQRFLLVTFPETGRYYLRLSPNDPGSGEYHVLTGLHVPHGERARDHRDVFVNWSDDGTAWSEPVRVDDDAGWFDDWLPEIIVSADGTAWVLWYDWRDSPPGTCGGVGSLYLARSNDGTDWSEQGPITDTPTPWPFVASNIIPNQGDYLGLTADHLGVVPIWADGRLGDPDVFTTRLAVPTRIDPVGAAVAPGRVTLEWYAPIASGLDAVLYRRAAGGEWQVLSTVASDTLGAIHYVDEAVTPGARLEYGLAVIEDGIERFAGQVAVELPPVRLTLGAIAPNPTAGELVVHFALPTDAQARVDLIDLAGRRVRSVELPPGAIGSQVVDLGRGDRLASGLYLVRLTQSGRSVVGKVTVIR